MAIKSHTGYPGSGKSHALVKDVIVPALLRGRRVVSNVSGLNWPAIELHCVEHPDFERLGELVQFDGADALRPGFWPEGPNWDDAETVIKRGDLIVFDEWALYFPNRGKWPDDERTKKFLAYHRHLAHPVTGASVDLHIAAQLPTALHQDIRGMCELTYKYKKLRAAGFENKYGWFAWQGHLQPKNEYFASGTSDYDKRVFPLYASSSAAPGQHVELTTNAKDTIWTKGRVWGYGGGMAALLAIVLWGGWSVWGGEAQAQTPEQAQAAPHGAAPAASGAPVAPRPPAASPWRIVGTVHTGISSSVILEGNGVVRTVQPNGCSFDADGMADRCTIDGAVAFADHKLGGSVQQNRSLLDGMIGR